jgi:DNA-binding response OmpR family regulator
LLSIALGKIVDQLRGSAKRGAGTPSEPALIIVEMGSNGEPVIGPPVAQTVLRVGPLNLNLLDRTAKRGDRQIDLRPREFQLLRYMMERSGKLLTRAELLRNVWHYKLVRQTNLVDVHMGLLRRKVDGPDEPPMIRSVRGAGFVMDACPLSPRQRRALPNKSAWKAWQE